MQEKQEADRRKQESQAAKKLQAEHEATRLQIEKLQHEKREADRRQQEPVFSVFY